MTDIFGRIITAPEIEQAALNTVMTWIDTYLTEVAMQISWPAGPAMARPRSYTTRNRLSRYPEDQLPQIIAVSPGLADPPVKYGGKYRGIFSLGIGAIVSAKDEVSTKALSKYYEAAIRALIIHHQDLGGIASGGVEWMDSSYDDVPDEEDTARSLAAGLAYFRVIVDDVVSWPGGPRDPYPTVPPGGQPGSTWPVVDSVIVSLKREAL